MNLTMPFEELTYLSGMKLTREKLIRMENDLGVNIPYQKGFDAPVRNCWHFSTDGNSVDLIFYDEIGG